MSGGEKTFTVQIVTPEGLAELEWLTDTGMALTWRAHREHGGTPDDMFTDEPVHCNCGQIVNRIGSLRVRLGFPEWAAS